MASLKRFSRNIGRVASDIRVGSHDRVVRTAVVLDRFLVQRTPVDTGRARSNWLVGINRPRRDVSGATSAAGAIAAGAGAALASRPGDVVFISNNLPYIDVLNLGSSVQAPAGFVEGAVSDALRATSRFRVLRRRGRR